MAYYVMVWYVAGCIVCECLACGWGGCQVGKVWDCSHGRVGVWGCVLGWVVVIMVVSG